MKLRRWALELKKRKVAQSRADINIGKRGIHLGVVEEVRRRLEQEGAVKIRVLRNARGKVGIEEIRRLAEAVNAFIADWRGYTFVLISKRRSPRHAAKH